MTSSVPTWSSGRPKSRARPAEVQFSGEVRPIHSWAWSVREVRSVSTVTTLCPDSTVRYSRLAHLVHQLAQDLRCLAVQAVLARRRGQRQQLPADAVAQAARIPFEEPLLRQDLQGPGHLRLLPAHRPGHFLDAHGALSEGAQDVQCPVHAAQALARHATTMPQRRAYAATMVVHVARCRSTVVVMCGIAAVHSPHATIDTDHTRPPAGASAVVEEMLGRLAHRGPDDSGTRTVGDHTWLGHRRLSIVDLDGGHQPLGGTDADDDWSLVCNGEIYNHQALRGEMPATAFGSSSDSAAGLAVLRTDGPQGLHRLRGMWALCAATPGGRFVAARDAVGIKPLYWARTDPAVYFASELRAFPPEVQPCAEIFPPGHWWSPQDGLRRFAEAVPGPARGTEAVDRSAVPREAVEKATFESVADSVQPAPDGRCRGRGVPLGWPRLRCRRRCRGRGVQ